MENFELRVFTLWMKGCRTGCIAPEYHDNGDLNFCLGGPAPDSKSELY